MTKTKLPKSPETTEFLPRLDASDRNPAALSVDLGEFEGFLSDSDWTEDQKREYLETIWSIMVEFALLGFGFHPVHQAQESCGKLSESRPQRPEEGEDQVDLKGQFESRAAARAAGFERGAL